MCGFFWNAHSIWAYVDPGTGFTFVSGFLGYVLGFVVLFLGAIGLIIKKWTGWFGRVFSKGKKIP